LRPEEVWHPEWEMLRWFTEMTLTNRVVDFVAFYSC
jgi:hypothetical protein